MYCERSGPGHSASFLPRYEELEVSLCLSEGRLRLLQHENGGSLPLRISSRRHIGAGFIGTSNYVRRRREMES